jgi:hypothetical protein
MDKVQFVTPLQLLSFITWLMDRSEDEYPDFHVYRTETGWYVEGAGMRRYIEEFTN